METAQEVISAMRRVAPPGRDRLDEATLRRLRELTRSLVAARPQAHGEYERFLSVAKRGMALDPQAVVPWIHGKTVLVTGGTGCIGSALLGQLPALGAAHVVSVSRGRTSAWRRLAGADYLRADIRDLDALTAIVGQVRPDVIFHVAAQRSPSLAETEVHRTVTTNLLGTRNVMTAAERSGVPQVVFTSTGKALRPYTPDVYAASKRAAEWLVSRAVARGETCYSAVRFTHVVDNSIIHQRLREWSADGVIRLHAADIVFYVQSALESAQLLLMAGAGARPGDFLVYAITDLGWPVGLLDMSLGMLQRAGSSSPIYLSGHDPGYESTSFPGLYDPASAGDLSPLLSIFEAPDAQKSPCRSADFFPLRFAPAGEADELMLALEETCRTTQDPDAVREALDALSWTLLDATLGAVPAGVLARAAAVTAPHRDMLSEEHRRMLAAIESHAQSGPRQPSAGVPVPRTIHGERAVANAGA